MNLDTAAFLDEVTRRLLDHIEAKNRPGRVNPASSCAAWCLLLRSVILDSLAWPYAHTRTVFKRGGFTYLVNQLERLVVVHEVVGEELDGVVGLQTVGLAEGLREHGADLVLLEVADVGVLLAQEQLNAVCNVCVAGGESVGHSNII